MSLRAFIGRLIHGALAPGDTASCKYNEKSARDVTVTKLNILIMSESDHISLEMLFKTPFDVVGCLQAIIY
jgi:hypothetical protein